jgi:hypothetical protein
VGIRCHWERKRFPDADFDDRDVVGKVHVRHREAKSPEHTPAGDPVSNEGGSWHGTLDWNGPAGVLAETRLTKVALIGRARQ